jgi:capsular polysaccharide biosynthesis protein
MEQLKSTLLNLQLKRTELLQKFDPSYRLVQEVDTEIKQTQAAIDSAGKSKVMDETTDSNPTYQWVDSELAKAQSQLSSEQARAQALSRSVQAYEEQASQLDQLEVTQDALLREKNIQEANYLLYMRKQEEARISDALDESRIINVAVVEPVAVPVVPSRSRALVLLLGLLAAIVVSLGVAGVAEYLDPSLRTSEDIKEFLDLPVLASVSDAGR